MDKYKREKYAETMSLNGIHTLSGYLPGMKSYSEVEKKGIGENVNKCCFKADRNKTYIVINPNKDGASNELITNWSQFLAKMEFILSSIDTDLNDIDVIRADFCFNSPNESSYEDYQKLHRLLIACLAKAYKFQNCYKTCGFWDYKQLSVAIKKDDSEIENYDKNRESNGQDQSANRLELRSKRMSGTSIQFQFMEKWFKRLDNAITKFEDVQMEQNEHLANLYLNDLRKNPKERDYFSLTAFLLQFKECIYTRKQMIDLLDRVGVRNPVKRADKFKEKHSIEYFSKKDLEFVVAVLKKKMGEYFDS